MPRAGYGDADREVGVAGHLPGRHRGGAEVGHVLGAYEVVEVVDAAGAVGAHPHEGTAGDELACRGSVVTCRQQQ
ncbi:hypothetical protein OG948_13755 [Embleya sp. NBC_00888]|nr:hypothetical protein OG948_13755 [Embleya sp. NBC_00888]